MKITFNYDLDRDIWCLLNKGKSSINSPISTKEYVNLVKDFGEKPTENNTGVFIEKFISDNNINKGEIIIKYQKDWNDISDKYQKIAEKIFGLSLPKDITAYLTINSRCPYKIAENYFYVSIQNSLHMRKIAMHELWHFYTWYKFGIKWEDKIGKEKYNNIKESLTALLNIECKYLLPEGISDLGYPQHKDLREKILRLWSETKDIDKVWNNLI